MQELFLKSKTQFIITFAAIALMGSALLLVVQPVSATSEGMQRPHGQRGHFRKHHESHKRADQAQQGKNRMHVIAGFLGLTPDELKARIKNGENPREIADAQGKTREQFKTYILDYMRDRNWFHN